MNKKINFIFSTILTAAILLTFLPPAVTVNAADNPNVNSIVLPQRVIYYGGNTYAQFFIPGAGWELQRDFCVELGKKSGVPAHLVYIKNAGIDSALQANKMGGVIGAFESNGLWSWLDGTSFGRMVPVLLKDENGEDYWSFHYEALGYDGWCKSPHEGAENGHVTFEKREPDSFIAPLCDQHYANAGSETGWHNHFEEPGIPFICEFEGEVIFVLADTNYDFDYNYRTTAGIHPYAPGIYADVGGYTVPKAILKNSIKVDSDILKKQGSGQYPLHTDRHYNFKGWAFRSKEALKIWNYDNKDYEPLEILQNEPTVVFYAEWERAESPPSDLECLAASMFVYVKALEKGKTVSETLNLKDNAAWKDIDHVLPNYKGGGNISMRDFMHAVIGGYVVEDYERHDGLGGSTFSAVFLKNAMNGSIISYRGTEVLKPESVITDIYMGSGRLNAQFEQAIHFYDKCARENAVTIITGHSLGGALAVHTGIIRDTPRVVTVNSAQGFSLPLTLIQKYGNDDDENKMFSFLSASLTDQFISGFLDEYNEYDDSSFEDISYDIIKKYSFYKYQPRLRSYAHESDAVSKPNRSNMVTEIFPEKLSNPFTAHSIDRIILYDNKTNNYTIAPTITRSPANLPAAAPTAAPAAAPTASKTVVNGKETAFDAYNINGNNYFKLRDLAYILNGTEKQFEVVWDGAANAITLISGKPYTAIGGEMAGKKAGGSQTANPTTSKIYLDGREVHLTAYNIDGNNYFKLRDIGRTFDFGVDWDGVSNTIVIDTGKQYTEE